MIDKFISDDYYQSFSSERFSFLVFIFRAYYNIFSENKKHIIL